MSGKTVPSGVRQAVLDRDRHRCRWCGRAVPVQVHHIVYRRGPSDDVAGNLIALCGPCHNFVHGRPSPSGATIAKDEAQKVLWMLVHIDGATGLELQRRQNV